MKFIIVILATMLSLVLGYVTNLVTTQDPRILAYETVAINCAKRGGSGFTLIIDKEPVASVMCFPV